MTRKLSAIALLLACGLPLVATASSSAVNAVDGVPGAEDPRGPNGPNDIGSAEDLVSLAIGGALLAVSRWESAEVLLLDPLTGAKKASLLGATSDVRDLVLERARRRQLAAAPGQQPSPPLPVSPPPSNPEDPSQAANTAEAKRTLGMACDSGESRGCCDLGALEHKSGNLAEARRLFAKACDGGYMGGCNNLGLLEKQAGNLAFARRLYARACVGNDMRACTNLGALEKQAGNLAESRRLFAQACNGGEALACSGLNALKIEEPPDAAVYTPEHVHLGLVLGLAKGSGLGGAKFAYGLRGGIRIWHIGIGFLVAASGQFSDRYGALSVYPILLPLNVIVDVNSIFSVFVGGQLGLVHYRRKGIISNDGYSYDQAVSRDVFADGLQAGGAVRLTSLLSLRFELAWVHADEDKTPIEVSRRMPWGTHFFGFVSPAMDFLHANGAVCITF